MAARWATVLSTSLQAVVEVKTEILVGQGVGVLELNKTGAVAGGLLLVIQTMNGLFLLSSHARCR